MIYVVKPFETITDVVLNATGSIDNWELILDANDFTDWVPILTVGQEIIIPDTVAIQDNVKRGLVTYPACNNAGIPDLVDQINDIIDILEGNLIFTADSTVVTADSTLATADYLYT